MFERFKIRALSDEELVKAFCKEGENFYLEELYGRYIRFVFLVCMKYIKNEAKAKDAAMQVFEKLADDLERFEIRNFKSWLHVVTKNLCLMQLRSEKGFETIPIGDRKDLQKNMENQPVLHPEDDGEHELKLEQLQKAIDSLETEQKKCIKMFYLEEKSYKEVADITGFSLNQVKSFIQNGKRNLKIILVKNGVNAFYFLICLLLNKL